MAKTALNMAASLRLLQAARLAWFLVLILGGEFIQFSSAASTNVTVLSAFTLSRDKLWDYMCNDCSDKTACTPSDVEDTFCPWLCPLSWAQTDSSEETECQTLCDDDQSVYCPYGDKVEVCEYDGSDESCMHYQPNRSDRLDVIYKCCVCGLDERRLILGMSCSDKEFERSSTTPNVAAIVLGSVLAVLLVAVALGLLCLFRTNRLKCGAGTGVTTADASIEMAQNDNEYAQGPRSIVSTNANEDASTRDGTTDHAYKSLHLSHEQSHYYSKIPESGGNPDDRAAQEEVTPSAPPTEGHEYFVLER